MSGEEIMVYIVLFWGVLGASAYALMRRLGGKRING